jgi:uncharacterized protein (DUF2126 family)/transglutaminase-like putative cysteine protease
VGLGPQLVRLRPTPHCRTPILSYSLRVTPERHFITWQQDPQSNYLARLVFPDRVRELRLTVDLVAEMAVYNPFDFFLDPRAEHLPFVYEDWQVQELAPFLGQEPVTPRFAAYLAAARAEIGSVGRPRTVDVLVDLNRQLGRDVRYVVRLDPGIQSKEETLALGSGSCRDSAWLLTQLLRHLGLAARFVSGYLIQLAPDVKALEGPPGPEHDFTDLHAWCEVYLPGAGWVGLDPTSGLLAGEGHIPLACTPEPASAAPVSGLVEPCEVAFAHTMSVARIRESPRVTRPYTDEQWERIVALGRAVDADLEQMDVRLTLGGEPTFVSIDDPEGAEWNTAALGPTKRRHAVALLGRLRAHGGAGGVVHMGQGKWYPGEPLPRWALGCYWRRDGEPIWSDAKLLADDQVDRGYGPAESEQFLRALAVRLVGRDDHVMPAYEDVWYYLWREGQLPDNVDPLDSRVDDLMERNRLRRVFMQGLGAAVGHALPIARDPDARGWHTGPWSLRRQRLYLHPGDSPMGYRLPLDSLPWVSPADAPALYPQDPTERRPPLPPHATLREPAWPRVRLPGQVSDADREATPVRRDPAADVVRTALCVEPRAGVLHVFLPPVARLEDYLTLLAGIEATASELGMPVALEGYPPPADPRLQHFMITPDPGVIEVNIHPAASWDELVEQTTTLYEEARQARLTTEKFMLDGRHSGTGGGNHIVLGGPTPADSPFLRRPDLLKSLLAYWHNHPSLSYLFAGLFLGPTSQAPRVDEARHDSVYELEIALRQASRRAEPAPPWLVDRLFRHLLVDVTGNTHRAEFCIDKLYSPETAGGRRGLVEMRAFEMPPHARMSLCQQLLLRALVARFWRDPYEARLARWGTELHDRFMLPYFVWQDFEDVLAELGGAGYPFAPAWFAPHFEFRFPLYGEIATRAIHLALRQALEPWHVLGEEGTAGGTARYVDSSVERLQVHLRGLTDDRYVVTCNGRRLPLQPTGVNGEYVAGVRYRAWQPSACLHPTIPVHSPLTFDIVDTWMERSLGGCQYHVAHPGGRSYERFPVNSAEAESRRRERFLALGHTPGRLVAPDASPSREFPCTLDLRA